MGKASRVPSVGDDTPQMLNDEVRVDSAWRGEDLSPEDWLVSLTEGGLLELDTVVQCLRRDPQLIHHLELDRFELTDCAKAMSRVRTKLKYQIGLAVLDRLPTDHYSLLENKAIYWVLTRMLGPIVDQDRDVYAVVDAGPAVENAANLLMTSPLHTDGAWLSLPPEFVSLLCLEPDPSRDTSRLVSLIAVHNEMRLRYAALLPRLYDAFHWRRRTTPRSSTARYSVHPIYRYNGRSLLVRYDPSAIDPAGGLPDFQLDDEGVAALEAMQSIVEAPESRVEFRLEKGQVQFVNNRQFAYTCVPGRARENARSQDCILRLWSQNDGIVSREGGGELHDPMESVA